MGRFNYRHALAIALTFAGFQAAMPLFGWLLAANFTSVLDPYDHWIAFLLLVGIGGKMGVGGLPGRGRGGRRAPGPAQPAPTVDPRRSDQHRCGSRRRVFRNAGGLLLQAILCIGLVTLATSFAAVGIGHRIGVKFRKPAEFLGGAVLIIIGVRILLQGLGLLA